MVFVGAVERREPPRVATPLQDGESRGCALAHVAVIVACGLRCDGVGPIDD
jgi:hypothetical protein